VGTIFFARPDRSWGQPSLLQNGYRVFPRGKVRPGRAADHSPPSSAAVMEEQSYTSTHPLGHTGPVTGSLYLYISVKDTRFHTITVSNFVVPTRSVRLVVLFRETGVVHRITYSLNYFFLLVVLFTQFIVDKIKKKVVLYQVKQLNHMLSK